MGVDRQLAVTEPARVARIVEAPRPEWRDLFREPDWPPFEEDEDG